MKFLLCQGLSLRGYTLILKSNVPKLLSVWSERNKSTTCNGLLRHKLNPNKGKRMKGNPM